MKDFYFNTQQPNTTHHRGATALRVEGMTLTRRYITKATQDVIKPAIKTFLETCNTNPRIAAVVATFALLGFLLVVAFFTISTLVLVVLTIFTIPSGIIFVIVAGIVAGIVSLFLKLLLLVLATLPLTAIATGLLVGANTVSQSIISRISQNGVSHVVTQTVREIDWKSVIEHLINFGKNLGPGFAAILERLVVHLRNGPPTDSTAETSGEPSQGNSTNSELQDPPTESLKRQVLFHRTSEDVVDGMLVQTSGLNLRLSSFE